MKLTKHQIRVVAAILVMTEERPGPCGRYHVAMRIGNPGGIHLKTMLLLQGFGLVEPSDSALVAAVLRGDCRCGCDRWQLTKQGFEFANRLNIHIAARPHD